METLEVRGDAFQKREKGCLERSHGVGQRKKKKINLLVRREGRPKFAQRGGERKARHSISCIKGKDKKESIGREGEEEARSREVSSLHKKSARISKRKKARKRVEAKREFRIAQGEEKSSKTKSLKKDQKR